MRKFELMKKLILLSFLILTSCTEDKSDCNCNAKYAIFKNGNVSYFYVNNVKVDCSTNKPFPNQNIQGDAVFIRCELMAYSIEEINKIFDYVCFEIEKGRALRNILKEEEMPSASTFYQWLDNNEEKTKQYARATEVRADVIFDDILVIADENTSDTYVNDNGIEVINNDVIQRSRLRIDARKWVLSKLNPKKYGDKTDITSGGEKIQNIPTTIQVEITKPNED